MAKVDWDDEGLDLASIFNFPDESMESWEGEEWDAFTSQNLGPIPEDFVIDPKPNTPSYPLKSGTTPETYHLDDADGLYVFQQNESQPRFRSPSPVSLLKPRTASKRKRSKRARPSGTSQWNLSLPILYTERANDAKRANGRRRNKSDTAGPAPAPEYAAEPRVTKKCSHCEITKTPQWREGPLGPKTLCNACGVRYRSGRLFPEYRPAASPTFVPSIHSNSHKKVVEMRNRGKHVERTQIEFNPVLSYLFDHTRL